MFELIINVSSSFKHRISKFHLHEPRQTDRRTDTRRDLFFFKKNFIFIFLANVFSWFTQTFIHSKRGQVRLLGKEEKKERKKEKKKRKKNILFDLFGFNYLVNLGGGRGGFELRVLGN